LPDPLVSVIIPAFNAERFIARTLDSVSAQTHHELEVIVVDDGSHDNTAEVTRAKAAADPRIRLVQQGNFGVAAARNRGFRESKGSFIAPLDSDDLWHPEKLERQLRRLQERSSAGLAYCWSVIINEDDRLIARPASPARFEGDVFAALIAHNFIGNASSVLIRREYLEQVGGFDETLRTAGAEGCEDYKLCLDVAERCDVALVPHFLVGYRRYKGSMSWNHQIMLRSHRLAIASVRSRRPELPGRIFRWSRARTEFYFGLRAFASGRLVVGLSLCLQGLARDPLLIFSAWFLRLFSEGVRKLAADSASDSPFYSNAHPDQPDAPVGWVLRRQRSFVDSIRIERPPRYSPPGSDRLAGDVD
jgi:glycosyltransferase involved in cell wall biosynthesis